MASPGVGFSSPPPVTPDPTVLTQVLKEYRLMLRYALSEGLNIDAQVQQLLRAVKAEPQDIEFADLLAAHTALAKIVAPATPLSLAATEPSSGPLGHLRRPLIITWMMIIAAVAS